jgi:hypothetical protein
VIRLIKNAAQQLNSQTDNIESCASTTSGKISNSLIGRSRFHFTATCDVLFLSPLRGKSKGYG